ncbi:MAG: hypothetical protein ABIR55_20185 [Burkholderiaceae bacterium]
MTTNRFVEWNVAHEHPPVVLGAHQSGLVELAEAVKQFEEEGGQLVWLARDTTNCHDLMQGMAALGFKPEIKTFRVGCFEAIGQDDMERAVHAVAMAMKDLGIVPALTA